MSIKNNKNNKNICLVLYIWKYGRQNYIIICMCFTAETIIGFIIRWLFILFTSYIMRGITNAMVFI